MISKGDMDTREWFTAARQDYLAVRAGDHRRRRSTIGLRGSDADYHYQSESDLLELIEIGRDVQRNDPVVSQAVKRLAHNVVQDGIVPKAATPDAAVNEAIDARWTEWVKAENCDIRGVSSFTDLQELALIQTIFEGDICLLPMQEGSLMAREAHRLRTPRNLTGKIVHGVECNGFRRPVRYWFTRDDVSAIARPHSGQFDPFDAEVVDDLGMMRNVMHVFSPQRVTQTRGVSALAQINDTLTFHDDLHFATLVKAQMAACVIMKRELDAAVDPLPGEEDDTSEAKEFSDGYNRRFEQMYPGMVIPGLPGEKIGMDSANVPSPEFFQHAELLCSIIAVNLGIPLCVFFLDARATNFSGFRGALDQARVGWQDLQYLLRDRMVRPTREWKIRDFMREDQALLRASRKLNLLATNYRLPGWKYIQPEIEANSDRFQIATLQTSPSRKAAERGLGEYRDIVNECVSDNEYAIIRAMEAHERIVARFPNHADRVHWEQCLVLPVPDGLRLNMSMSEQTTTDSKQNVNVANK